jgi:protein-export membrane protein SecD
MFSMKQVWRQQSSRKKVANAKKAGSSEKKPWLIRTAAVVALLATVCVAFFDFPVYFNKTVDAVGLPLPQMEEEDFRLGLDLQGGTHLVYEADMSDIPEDERAVALEGVKDVIERRVNAFGVSEPVVQTTTTGGTYRVIIELAGVLDVSEAINQIGETPVLEFKEPGNELEREPTQEEYAELETLNATEMVAAEDALARARAGEDFVALVEALSVKIGEGVIEGATAENVLYGDIVERITYYGAYSDYVVPEVIETTEGLNIVKTAGTTEVVESELSHILICYEGKAGCTNPISELEASIQIGNVKDQATPENFAQLAAEYSTGPSASQGGSLGWVKAGQMVAPFEIAYQALAVGEISNVVETDFGYHLIYKSDEWSKTGYNFERVVLNYSDIFTIVPPVSPWANTELSGKHLEKARVEFDMTTGQPHVTLQFNAEGGDLFGELTAEHVGEQIAIFLDGEVISAPRVQSVIYGGTAVITGNFTVEEAKLLAQRLNAGALPVPVDLLSQQTVGPTLGAISLSKSISAALFGFLLVGLFMIGMYRLPGFVSVVALILYAFLNLAAYRVFGVTISLAGIAGFVLSLGIAVDANVLIIERLREELNSGRDYSSAVDEAFKRAWTAIRDGNITTLIAAGVLYWFSSSFIKGFALTLSIGVILSMFTAITITRVYLLTIIDCSWITKYKWLFGQEKKEN